MTSAAGVGGNAMDSKAAHQYVGMLHGLISRDPWDFDPGEDLPDWYRRALSAVALLSEGEEPAYVSGQYRAGTVKLHLFFADSVVTIDAGPGDDDIAKATVIQRPRAGLLSLKIRVSQPPSADLFRRDLWPGKVFVVAHYGEGPALELPVSATNDPRMSDELRQFLPSLQADLGARPEQS
jgi:hypothetical protein